MSALRNDNSDFLRRRRRSLLDIIERREGAILIARQEQQDAQIELRIVERQLAEYKKPKKGERP